MHILKTIRDKDFNFDFPKPSAYKERVAARIVLLDDENKIGFIQSKKYNFFKLPGGGVEEGEEILETLRRESLEEIGCEIKDIRELGITDEWRNKTGWHQQSYCYIARLNGQKGEPNFMDYELEHEYEILWLDLDYALNTLEKEILTNETYDGKYGLTRDIWCLQEAKKILLK